MSALHVIPLYANNGFELLAAHGLQFLSFHVCDSFRIHHYSPLQFEDCTFEWLYWPQAREAFTPEETAYIDSLDAEKDIELLNFYGWNVPEKCARVFRISTMLLKKGAERGLTPFLIGSIMCRETVKKESVIEKMVLEAEQSLLPGTSESAFLDSISAIMDRYLDGLSP